MELLTPNATLCVKIATTEAERAHARTLRRLVFCDEQKIFSISDADAIDAKALVLIAVLTAAYQEEQPTNIVGTVRIHEEKAGLCVGSRLAVAQSARRSAHVGTNLIKLAVGIAHAHNCRTFHAQVQRQHVGLFERLYWTSLEEQTLHGLPHHLMQANLACYPPIYDGDLGRFSVPENV